MFHIIIKAIIIVIVLIGVTFLVMLQTGHSLQLGKPLGRPLKTEILSADEKALARVLIYIDYVEIVSLTGELLGKVGIVNLGGRFELFVVKEDGDRSLVGWAKHRTLYDATGLFLGTYDWHTFWSYTYSAEGKLLGKAKCIAFRGYCAVGIAAYLHQLL